MVARLNIVTLVNMLHIIPIPAFDDNYIWLLHNNCHAVVIDPGDAAPVVDFLQKNNLILSNILITHHHSDHIDGVHNLLKYQNVPVYAPQYEAYTFKHNAVSEGSVIQLSAIDLQLRVMWLPGHTLGHIAFYNSDYLFCGDTLFSAGCGRLFEGTPKQMLHSLNRLKQLNPATKVFCTHEYTLKNVAFALTLEPSNHDLKNRLTEVQRLQQQQLPTLPTTIQQELNTNPFLRCMQAEIWQHSGSESSNELSVFTAIRALRNHY